MQKKVILITGASSGIGKQLALDYASKGFNLVLAARRTDLLVQVKSECEIWGVKCKVFAIDLEQAHSIPDFATQALAAFGRIDILINNAGISQRGSAAQTEISVVRKMMEINFFPAITLSHTLLDEIRKNKGSIVVISSMSGLFGFHDRSAYSASKFALHGYFETLNIEEPGVHVLLVCPGRVKTDISLSALSADGSKHGIMDKAHINGISVEKCSEKIIRAVDNKKSLILIAKEEKILYWLKKISYSLFIKIARKAKSN
ncbi:MAG: SDR family oxidoreductase [Bacteroidetes bacterium]|nr:SDR family oxidoreductase [Bacteroidota bacterium]